MLVCFIDSNNYPQQSSELMFTYSKLYGYENILGILLIHIRYPEKRHPFLCIFAFKSNVVDHEPYIKLRQRHTKQNKEGKGVTNAVIFLPANKGRNWCVQNRQRILQKILEPRL